MTKKERHMFMNYINSNATYLHDVYDSYSSKKERAYEYCREDMLNHNGSDSRIPTSNTFQFTYAFRYKGDNGEIRLRYHTPSNVYDFEII